MKYIVILAKVGDGLLEIPIIFPSHLIHADTYESVCHQMVFKHEYEPVECVAAGDINLLDGVFCSGRSDTLNVGSRGEEDERLIKMYNYAGGWI